MPKLWVDTIEAHRREVHDAIVSTTAALVAQHGPAAVTMSQIADETRIGRATLYKYFSDVESILDAWHERYVTRHLASLTAVRDQQTAPMPRLEAVLQAYALSSHERNHAHDAGTHAAHAHRQHAADISALVHRSEHVAAAQRRLTDFFGELLRDAMRSGDVRDDVSPAELAAFCIHSLAAAASLPTKPAVTRLVDVTLSALRPRRAKR